MSDNIDSKLVQSAMKIALLHRRPEEGLLHHSNNKVQCAATDFQDLLDDNKVICNISRKGNSKVTLYIPLYNSSEPG